MELKIARGKLPQAAIPILSEMPMETAKELYFGEACPDAIWLVAFEKEEPAGIALLLTEEGEDTGYLHLYIREKHRSKGIGSALASQMIQKARELGLFQILSDYCVDMGVRVKAESFAFKFGFQGQFVFRYMVYKGGYLPEPALKFVPYREEYFDEMYRLISNAFYPMREANHLEPYRFTWGKTERREFAEHASDFFLLFENGEMIASGYASGGEIDQVAVREDCRGRGLGRAIVCHGVNQSLRKGFQQVSLYVLEWNRPAWSLYESLGFVTYSKRMFGKIDLSPSMLAGLCAKLTR